MNEDTYTDHHAELAKVHRAAVGVQATITDERIPPTERSSLWTR